MWILLDTWVDLTALDFPWSQLFGAALCFGAALVASYIVGYDKGVKSAVRRYGCTAKIAERYRREAMNRGEE